MCLCLMINVRKLALSRGDDLCDWKQSPTFRLNNQIKTLLHFQFSVVLAKAVSSLVYLSDVFASGRVRDTLSVRSRGHIVKLKYLKTDMKNCS